MRYTSSRKSFSSNAYKKDGGVADSCRLLRPNSQPSLTGGCELEGSCRAYIE